MTGPHYRAAFARRKIEVFAPDLALLGWGVEDNRAQANGTPLFVRSMVLEAHADRMDEGTAGTLAYVCLDLCFPSASLRAAILQRLRREESTRSVHLMLTATHTHAGPSGYNREFFYELSGPGFSAELFDHIVDTVVTSITAAHSRLKPARVMVGSTPVAPSLAHNRSMAAFGRNPEARRIESVDRRMTVLRVDDDRGRPMGAISFFGLHATCIHSDQRLLHGDHKTLAAMHFDQEIAEHDFVSIFAQTTAGDVTPNYRYCAARGFAVGPSDNDLENVQLAADAQSSAALALFHRLPAHGRQLEGPFRIAEAVHDLERFDVGRKRTTEAILGVGMAAGTREGPGPLGSFAAGLRALSRLRQIGRLDAKIPMLRVGAQCRGRMARFDPWRLPISHPAIQYARETVAGGRDLEESPWITTELPVQLVRWGSFFILGLPNEPTTVTGRRLRSRIGASAPALDPAIGVVQGYTNAYAGYLTTPEEYAAQAYEGAYTLFGPHTLAAFGQITETLAREVDAGKPTRRA